MHFPATLLAGICCLLLSCQRHANAPAGGQWVRDANQSEGSPCPGKSMPLKYRMLTVDYPRLRNTLLDKKTTDTLVLQLPFPEGQSEPFKIYRSQVMAPELEQKYPGIATFQGYRISNPAEIVRLDISPAGLHAMVLGSGTTIFIDPYCPGDSIHLISYYKKDLPADSKVPFEQPQR